MIDVVGVLSSESLMGNLYLFDNNRRYGSNNEGTGILKTFVKEGDQIIWTAVPIEPEAFASITSVDIDENICHLEKGKFEGSDIDYWKATVLKNIDSISYQITYKLGNSINNFTTTEEVPFLIGTEKTT